MNELNPRITDALAQVWESTGMRDVCLSCIRKDGVGPIQLGGCCHHCEKLSKDGCTEKPISCAIWMCQGLKDLFPAVDAKLYAIQRDFSAPWWQHRTQTSTVPLERENLILIQLGV